jgi:hypothetical protein
VKIISLGSLIKISINLSFLPDICTQKYSKV